MHQVETLPPIGEVGNLKRKLGVSVFFSVSCKFSCPPQSGKGVFAILPQVAVKGNWFFRVLFLPAPAHVLWELNQREIRPDPLISSFPTSEPERRMHAGSKPLVRFRRI